MDKEVAYLSALFDKLSAIINKVPAVLIVLIPLVLLYVSQNLNGNEEQYMQLAKQYVNPDWIPESQNLSEIAGTRIIYQLIVGHTLQFLSFEMTVFLFRCLLILGFSIVLHKIYKKLSIDNFQVLLHLLFFLLIFGQSFFAGSWILVTVEPKGFSYLFVLLTFSFLLEKRFVLSLISIIAASYFHVLVGGYSFAYLLLTLFIFRKDYNLSFKQLVLAATVYTILLTPMVIHLNTSSLAYVTETNSEVSPSWIYTYFRSPHHTALFKSLPYFVTMHFIGILKCVVGLFVAIVMYPILKAKNNLMLINQFVIVSMIGTLLLIPIAFFDKEGSLLKFYLYRINTLSTFFLALLVPMYLYCVVKEEMLNTIKILSFVLCLLLFVEPSATKFLSNINSFRKERNGLDDISAFIKNNTNPKSLIFSYNEPQSIIRKSERSYFVTFKSVPAELAILNRWHQRVLEWTEVKKDPAKMKGLVDKYRIHYILVPESKAELFNTYELIYQNVDFRLYETGVKVRSH